MPTARKLPSGNFRVRVYVGTINGKKQYHSITAPTKKEAEKAASNYLGTHFSTDSVDITLLEASNQYVAFRSNVLSPSTISGYRKIVRNQFTDIANYKISKLNQTKIQQWVNRLSLTLSPKSVANAHGLLTAVLKQCMPTLVLTTKLPQKKKASITIPTEDQISMLAEAVKETELELPVMLAALAGLRRSEICALTYDDIDFKNNALTVNKAMIENDSGEHIIKPAPKSYTSNRTIVIPSMVIEIITRRKNENLPIVSMNPKALSLRFIRVVKGLDFKCRFHDLRHYNASIMLALNIPDKYAMERLGHATNSMLKTVYQHTISDKQKEVADTLNKYFSENV